MTFGEKIRELRNAKGWSQTQLAEAAGVSSGRSGDGKRKGDIRRNGNYTRNCLKYWTVIHPI